MSRNNTGLWESLERHRSTAFLFAGLIFVVDAIIIVMAMSSPGDDLMLLGQAFIAAGWTAGFIGLLGVFPRLADQNRRTARAGAVFVGVGLVVFVVMGVASLAYFSGALSGGLSALAPLFLPGVVIGSVLGFLTFGAATLRTGVYSRHVGILFVVLALIPVVNIGSGIAGIQSMTATLVVVVGLALVNFALAYTLRTADVTTESTKAESQREPAA